MNKRDKDKVQKVVVKCAQSLLDQLGEDTNFMIVLSSKDTHCTVCTQPMEIARSLMVNMADENSVNRDTIYNILKMSAASLLLCKELDFHEDFENTVSECLLETLTK